MNYTGCRIEKITTSFPERILTNADLEVEFPDFKAAKIEKKLGIRSRHIVKKGETALDLGVQAAEKLFENFDRNLIDYVLFCTQSPDYILPTSACILQDRLKLKKNLGALDFNLGCSGFVYGLSLAKGLIAGGMARRVLLLTAETYSTHINPKDRGNRAIFGDGAAATLVSAAETEKVGRFSLWTDGSGAENLIIRNGGARHPVDPAAEFKETGTDNDLFMNGPEIFNFTIEIVPVLIEDVLRRNELKLEEIDHFVFHQANKYMLNYLMAKLNLPADRFHVDLEETGNTVSATIPILLEKLAQKRLFKPGEKILLAGFGVGYSYGAVMIEY